MSNQSFFSKLSEDVKETLKKVADDLKAYKVEMAEAVATAAAADPSEAPSPSEMTEATLKDGTVIKYSLDANGALGIGSDVVIVSAEGEVPAPDGELILADGTVISVASGKVTEIVPAEVESEGMKEEVKKVSERVTKIVEKFEAIEAENKTLRSELESLKLKVGKQAASLATANGLLLSFSEIETAEPIEKPIKKSNTRLGNLINATKK